MEHVIYGILLWAMVAIMAYQVAEMIRRDGP
jgi:hypothetical protein